MNFAICTLFEGSYHYGLGALVNSLYQNGFRGIIWAGYRGELPPWAQPLKPCENFQEFEVAEGCVIRFVPVTTKIHMTNFKPAFMRFITENLDDADYLFYFDPDIVVKCRWSFFIEWVSAGIAVCGDFFPFMAPDHPFRHQWKKYAEKRGYHVVRQVNRYFNAGFIGLPVKHKAILSIWDNLVQGLPEEGIPLDSLILNDRTNPFNQFDQDMLNLTFMVCSFPISSMGPEAMDIIGTGFTMTHAIGAPKPWQKRFLSQALSKGKRPGSSDRIYFQYAIDPVKLYSEKELRAKFLDMSLGSFFGRIIPSRG